MFMHKSKKGFTIVELVIVIAVIAILAAVLIPTFSNLVKKANQSADIQAARQMNTVLAAEGAAKKVNIFEVYDALAANGMTAKDYRPLTTDHYFFWDDGANCIVYTDKNYQVVFPVDFEKNGNWVSLTATIPTVKPAAYKADATTVKVASAEELAYVVEQFKGDKHTASSLTIDLDGKELDMNGANLALSDGTGKDGGVATTTEVTITNGTIKNVSAIDPTYQGKGGDGHEGIYYTGGLFGNIESEVTLENVVIENVYVKNTSVSGAGLLAASVQNGGKLIVKGITTIKNCTVIGHRNVGALVGYAHDAIELYGTINMENVTVMTVGGRSGLLFGIVTSGLVGGKSIPGGGVTPNKFVDESTINLTNCSYEYYACDQNTGTKTIDGKTYTLGKDADGHIVSWALDNNGNPEIRGLKADGTKDTAYRYDAGVNFAKGTYSVEFNNIVVK